MSRTTAPAPADREDGATASAGGLTHGLKQRHLSMIALGGVIGAGLFVGSGAGIAAAGPSIVIAYALSGVLVMLVMRMLGEMSAANPASGSFSVHAERAFGPWAGFTAGWAFWFLLCVAVGLEGIGAAKIMTGWFPGSPEWAWVALFMLLLTAANLTAVKNFGEFEFWFAALKVAAIALFLVIGVLAILGALPGTEAPGTAHLTGEGGFFPQGSEGLIVGLLASVFAYGGLETVTIAAAESEQPVRGVAKAVRTAMWRIALFYIGSMAVIVTLVPWGDPAVVEKGPYVATLDRLGIPATGQIMNVVVLVALLSAMNANIYGASRMAGSLVARGQGPKALGRVSGGVPRPAVLVSSVFGFGCVLLSYWRPDDVFAWLLNTIGAIILVVWFFIAASQLVLRRRTEREAPETLVVRMWAFPVLTWVALAGMATVFVLMAREEGTRVQLYSTGGLTLLLAAVGFARQRAAAGRAS
ncbi:MULTISPECIES: amino acid permease [unclassified Streptomyces]|uniref:amino acid permease n=1 Tax=unclassified Streptomyces TaxID=2593676 RepID=UPI0016611D21|nr:MULTISPECIES: amino acid permease [unclassified Streptomyces]MBD0709715.1 amino acid transporter [Streptomyces sp. CBMA291]MBD0715320.1 amino acid transporter [Streptomyces sp. CBMA370]